MEVIDVIGIINYGGFGKIERVRLKDRSFAARKTFEPNNQNLTKDQIKKFRERFIREVRVMERLPENMFIKILYSNLDGENPWYLMPVATKVYDQQIALDKKLNNEPEGLADILNSLEHLHKMGLKHRDLKPPNILFHDGSWKLADFGLISADHTLNTTFTSTNSALGTQLYCAPEQIQNFHSVQEQADIYSFGCILHDIYGDGQRVPYRKQTAPGTIGLIIEKCTDENPLKRFPNVRALRSVLLSVLAKGTKEEKASTDTTIWLEKIENENEWSEQELEAFMFYINRYPEEADIIFYDFTKELLLKFKSVNELTCKTIIAKYCEWIMSQSFNFGYCDVLIQILLAIYESTDDNEIKSQIILSSSRLGASHNRWYVMGYVLKMASNIDDELANRISIEIYAGDYDAKWNLQRCALQLKKELDEYHPLICEALQD